MSRPDRLSGLDAAFLAHEKGGAHMHVGSVLVFDGPAPDYDAFVAHLERRLPLVPRYRQKLAFPPLPQSRPVWVDDAHFNARYHVRHTGLAHPGGEAELRRLAGRIFGQRLDRTKPLWELWLVDRVAGNRFAIVVKTHHCVVDGISGVDITTVLLDLDPEPPPAAPSEPWIPRPEPSRAALLADALRERTAAPAGLARAAAAVAARPGAAARAAVGVGAGLAALGRAGVEGAPPSPLNVPIGPHRRFAWVDADLRLFKRIKDTLGGTVNDVVLAVVAGGLRAHYLAHGHDPAVELKAMVPVSVRADRERGALGNRIAAVYAPLPLGLDDPVERFRAVHESMRDLKASGQAVGAELIAALADFAPPTILAQAARTQAAQRFFNLAVTNVPGPQFPLYLLGGRLSRAYPHVPLAEGCALGVAILSYDGRIDFGLVADYDAVADLDALAGRFEAAIGELGERAGVARSGVGNGRARTRQRA